MTKRKKKRLKNVEVSKLLPEDLAEALIEMADRALRGIKDSSIFIGMTDERGYDGAERIEFMLQVGYCVLHDKPIVLPVPHGIEVPAKLAAVADKILRYDPKDLSSLEAGLRQYFTEAGVIPQ